MSEAPGAPGRPRVGGLVRLAILRTFPPRTLVVLAILAALAVTRDWGLSPDALPDGLSPEDGERIGRGFCRQGVWTLLLILVAPLLVHRAASTLERWREEDAEWLASRPVSRLGVLVAAFLGTWLAGALVLAGIGVLAEVAAGGSGPTSRLDRELSHASVVLFEDEGPARWEQTDCPLAELPAGTRARLRPTVALGSGPVVSLRITASSSGGEAERAEATARISGRSVVEVPVPAGAEGHLVLELAREGPGAVLVLPPDGGEILVPLGSDRWVGVELLARLLVAAGAWIAVGLGLGAWMRPPVAALGVFALWALPWWWGLGATWVPGGDLPRVWGMLGEGIAPPLPDARGLVGFAVLLAVGLGAAIRGLSRGRSLA